MIGCFRSFKEIRYKGNYVKGDKLEETVLMQMKVVEVVPKACES